MLLEGWEFSNSTNYIVNDSKLWVKGVIAMLEKASFSFLFSCDCFGAHNLWLLTKHEYILHLLLWLWSFIFFVENQWLLSYNTERNLNSIYGSLSM